MPRREISEHFLIREAYVKVTRDKYEAAVSDFAAWCDANQEQSRSAADMDLLLTDYIHDLYEEGGSKGTAVNAVYGVIMFLPHYRKCLPTAVLCLKGWNRKHPPVPYPPLSWNLTVAIAARLRRRVDPVMALGVLLAFDCYLRIGELLGLCKEDVAVPGDVRLEADYSDVALALRKTKTGPNKSVVVADPAIRELLLQVVAQADDGALLFPFSKDRFRKHFKAACVSLGLSPKYVPHSLRHGGATRDHMRGKTLEDILARGRWASTKSARHYVQAGRALLLATRTPVRVARLGEAIGHDLLHSFSLPQMH